MTEEKHETDESDVSFTFYCLLKTIEARFSNVRQISTGKVYNILQKDGSDREVLLLDVRERNEYEVSHLPNAENLQPSLENFSTVKEKLEGQAEGTDNLKIVCYCSLGYRSSAMAQKLADALRDRLLENNANIEIFNLTGGIFKWANEKKQMIDNSGERTIYAHPYNILWGKFLSADLRKWELSTKL